MNDARLQNVAQLLEQHGIAAEVGAAGHDHDVLALRAATHDLQRLRELAPELKALGFKYVTLELELEYKA